MIFIKIPSKYLYPRISKYYSISMYRYLYKLYNDLEFKHHDCEFVHTKIPVYKLMQVVFYIYLQFTHTYVYMYIYIFIYT